MIDPNPIAAMPMRVSNCMFWDAVEVECQLNWWARMKPIWPVSPKMYPPKREEGRNKVKGYRDK